VAGAEEAVAGAEVAEAAVKPKCNVIIT